MSRKALGLFIGGAISLAGVGVYFLGPDTRPPGDTSSDSPMETARNDTPAIGVARPGAEVVRGSANTEPAQLIEDALAALPSLPPNDQDAVIGKLITQLRAAGPAGLRAVAEFLRTGRDVALRDEYGMRGNRVTSASSLRVALLDALANWEGSAAVLLEFLRSPASGWEIVLAIRNLELEFPSTYRKESVAALKSALARPAAAGFGSDGEAHVFAAVARLGASDLLPQAEALAVTTSNVPRYIETLAQFPAEIREPALARVLSRPEVAEEIVAAPQTVQNWSFENAQTRAFLLGVFRARLAPEQRVAMLDGLDARPPILAAEERLFVTPQHAREADRAAHAAALREANARKAFLAELAADETQSAAVQAAAKDAQRRITAEIAAQRAAAREEARPLVEIDFAQGAGKAQIKGRRIEQIELQAPVLSEAALGEDSTESPPR